MIEYFNSIDGIKPSQLPGFFVDWPNPPSLETHLRILAKSAYVVIAVDTETAQVIGFITAISDGLLSAYIPLLEVLPNYQNRGIGSRLIRLMLEQLGDLYMIDLLCDSDLQGFYQRFGMQPASGMIVRNYKSQAGVAK